MIIRWYHAYYIIAIIWIMHNNIVFYYYLVWCIILYHNINYHIILNPVYIMNSYSYMCIYVYILLIIFECNREHIKFDNKQTHVCWQSDTWYLITLAPTNPWTPFSLPLGIYFGVSHVVAIDTSTGLILPSFLFIISGCADGFYCIFYCIQVVI